MRRSESYHNRMVVRAYSRAVASSLTPFLETEPIKGVGVEPVRYLRFVIMGRCQEWDLGDTRYAGSWYELSVRSDSNGGGGCEGDVYTWIGPRIAKNSAGRKKYQVGFLVIDLLVEDGRSDCG